MSFVKRLASWTQAHPRASTVVLVAACSIAGFGVGSRQPAAANLSVSTIDLVSANLAHSTKVAGGAMPPAAMGAADTPIQSAPSLSALLPGLEAKVAAHPDDFALRLLLAQTYLELDHYTKAIPILDGLAREAPQNAQVALLSVKAQLPAANPASLRTALNTLDTLNRDDIDGIEWWMLRGRVLVRMSDRVAARDAFMKAQSLLSAGDPRADDIEMELAHLANGVSIAQ